MMHLQGHIKMRTGGASNQTTDLLVDDSTVLFVLLQVIKYVNVTLEMGILTWGLGENVDLSL